MCFNAFHALILQTTTAQSFSSFTRRCNAAVENGAHARSSCRFHAEKLLHKQRVARSRSHLAACSFLLYIVVAATPNSITRVFSLRHLSAKNETTLCAHSTMGALTLNLLNVHAPHSYHSLVSGPSSWHQYYHLERKNIILPKSDFYA